MWRLTLLGEDAGNSLGEGWLPRGWKGRGVVGSVIGLHAPADRPSSHSQQRVGRDAWALCIKDLGLRNCSEKGECLHFLSDHGGQEKRKKEKQAKTYMPKREFSELDMILFKKIKKRDILFMMYIMMENIPVT